MGLTYSQAIAIGIGHLHPDAAPDLAPGRPLVIAIDPPRLRSTRRTPDGLNKLERRFRDEILQPAYAAARIDAFSREPVKLRIAGRTFYTPDFLVIERPDELGLYTRLTFVECKGFMRDDASVKLKTVATLYPCFDWLLVTRPNRSWEIRRVDHAGIGRNPITVPWI